MRASGGKPAPPQQILKSDLKKLMDVVNAAAGIYNVLEALGEDAGVRAEVWAEYLVLGQKLRALGLNEVTNADQG